MSIGDSMQAKHIIERRLREVYSEAQSQSRKNASPDQERRVHEIRRMNAACSALDGFIDLAQEDIAGGDGRALGDAAMKLLADKEVKEAALEHMANRAVAGDNPAVWEFCMAHGFKPFEAGGISAENSWGSSNAEPSSWLGKALNHDSWDMAILLASRPEGRAGVPEERAASAKPKEQLASVPKRKSKKSSLLLDGYFDQDEDHFGWIARRDAHWWRQNDPILLSWSRDAEEKPYPAAVKKALRDNGFTARFGARAFDIAAAELALEGRAQALAACLKAKISPDIAYMKRAGEAAEIEWGGDVPRLAISGGVKQEKGDAAAWTEISSWIDGHMGAGFSERLCVRGALKMLRAWESDKFKEYGDRKGSAALAIAWLANQSPASAAETGEQLAFLQGLAIGLAEIDRGEPRPEQTKIKTLMDKWSVAASGSPAPARRVLKA